jgi:hypothetical protein
VLAKAAAVGDKDIEVEDIGGCKAGDLILIDGLDDSSLFEARDDSKQEMIPAYLITGNLIIFATPLAKAHAENATVTVTTANTTNTTAEPICIALPQGSAAGCPPGQEITTSDECRSCADELGFHRSGEWQGSNSAVPTSCSWRDRELNDLHFNSVAVGTAQSDMIPICRKVARPNKANKTADKFELLEAGALCKPGSDIQSIEECEEAHDVFGLRRAETFIGSTPMIPTHCSWRDRNWDNFHWNTASAGRPRADLHPLCRKTVVVQEQEQVGLLPGVHSVATPEFTQESQTDQGALASALDKTKSAFGHLFR